MNKCNLGDAITELLHGHCVLFCYLAVLDPRVGNCRGTVQSLSPKMALSVSEEMTQRTDENMVFNNGANSYECHLAFASVRLRLVIAFDFY